MQFDEDQWHSTLRGTLRMEELITKHSAIMDKYDPKKRVGLIIDESGTWYDPEPGTNPGFLYQQNSLRDALVAAINLNIFHAHCDRVQMTNIAQMINVLQAMILTDKERLVLTPTYHVFKMYKVHQGATYIPVELKAPEYKVGDQSVPSVHASASRDQRGKLHISLVNLDPNKPAEVHLKVSNASISNFSGQILTAPATNSFNDFKSADVVKPIEFNGFKADSGGLTVSLPSKCVVCFEGQ